MMTIKDLWDIIGSLPPDTPVVIDASERGLGTPALVEVRTVAKVREESAWNGPYDTEFDEVWEEIVGEPILAVVIRR